VSYTDRSIACVDCGQEFTFTAGEQEFYAQRGFTESPKRCPSCRQIRKAQRSREGGSSRGDSFGGGRSGNGGGGYGESSYGSGGYGNGGYSDSGYSASGGYSAGGYSSGDSGGYSSGGGGGYSSGGGGYSGERRQREMFDATCANCGKTASVPFRPSGSKPVYCSDCFESRR
jgi:CxxC-x17-CxxC domain-containing protein